MHQSSVTSRVDARVQPMEARMSATHLDAAAGVALTACGAIITMSVLVVQVLR